MLELALTVLLTPLMAVMNRIRGMYGAGGIIGGVALGGALFLITKDPIAAAACAVLYFVGESVGWGRWLKIIPAMENNVSQQVYWDKYRQPERGKFIHKLANKIAKEKDDYRRYAKVALYIRACIWFPPIFIALALTGHANWAGAGIASLFCIYCFPLAYGLAYDKSSNGWWGRGEVYYGIVQGATLTLALLSHLIITI